VRDQHRILARQVVLDAFPQELLALTGQFVLVLVGQVVLDQRADLQQVFVGNAHDQRMGVGWFSRNRNVWEAAL
jgi:hypothetical protein